MIVMDSNSFDDLVAWVKAKMDIKDDKEAKSIAFAIINKRKKKGKDKDKEDSDKSEAGKPKKDGSGKGIRENKGRGGTLEAEQEKVGKGKETPRSKRAKEDEENQSIAEKNAAKYKSEAEIGERVKAIRKEVRSFALKDDPNAIDKLEKEADILSRKLRKEPRTFSESETKRLTQKARDKGIHPSVYEELEKMSDKTIEGNLKPLKTQYKAHTDPYIRERSKLAYKAYEDEHKDRLAQKLRKERKDKKVLSKKELTGVEILKKKLKDEDYTAKEKESIKKQIKAREYKPGETSFRKKEITQTKRKETIAKTKMEKRIERAEKTTIARAIEKAHKEQIAKAQIKDKIKVPEGIQPMFKGIEKYPALNQERIKLKKELSGFLEHLQDGGKGLAKGLLLKMQKRDLEVKLNKLVSKFKEAQKSTVKSTQTKLPVKVKGTGKRKEPYKEKATIQTKITQSHPKPKKKNLTAAEKYIEYKKSTEYKKAKAKALDKKLKAKKKKKDFITTDFVGHISCLTHEEDLKINDIADITNDSILRGVITRAGPFRYGDSIKWKKWSNIKKRALEKPMVPLYDSHKEDKLLGFVDNWQFNEAKEHLIGDIHTFNPIEQISNLKEPKDIQVSMSYWEGYPKVKGVQNITGFRNVAMSVDNVELDRCSSVDGFGRCVVNKVGDFINHSHNIDKRPMAEMLGLSSQANILETYKIITDFGDNTMPNEIEQIISDFKKTYDNSVLSGNEVEGNTIKQEFVRTLIEEGFSPNAAESAWSKYIGQGSSEGSPIDINTGGHKKTVATMSDFADKIESLEGKLEKYEDFFKAEQAKKGVELLSKLTSPFTEEGGKILSDFSTEELEKLEPVFDTLFEEHPELVQSSKTADVIADMNTNDILKAIGRDKKNLRETKDFLTNVQSEAEKAMASKWEVK